MSKYIQFISAIIFRQWKTVKSWSIIFGFILFSQSLSAQLSGVVTVGTIGADYTSLTNVGGVFQTISTGTLDGDLIVEIISDLTSETGAFALQQWSEIGVGNYTVTIRPDGNTLRTVQGSYQGTAYANEGLYRLDGVARVCFDGRDPNNLSAGGRHLLFRNTNKTSTYYQSTFNFINGCNNDTLRYLYIEGAAFMSNVGVVRFGRYLKGNYDILVDNCHIRDLSTTGDAVGSGIYSYGVSGAEANRNITISNNEIYNIWRGNTDNYGIYINIYSTDFTITGNHIYLNSPKNATGHSVKYGIAVVSATSGVGDNFIIRDNYIGGSEAFCGGLPMEYNSFTGDRNVRFCGIYFRPLENASNSVIENNKINNIIWKQRYYISTSNVVPFTGIQNVQGNTLIKNNIIGAPVGNDSIMVYCGDGTANMSNNDPLFSYGILINSGNVNVENNSVGAIKFIPIDLGDKGLVEFTGIYISQYDIGGNDNLSTAIVTDNLIGSETTALSIETTCPGVSNTHQPLIGIYCGSEGVNIIEDNVIANMHNGNDFYYTRSQTLGILTNYEGQKIIKNNKIFSLSNNAYFTGDGYTATVVGIKYYSSTSTIDSIVGNTIYDLRNTTVRLRRVGVTGIGITGTTKGGSLEIARNNIHSFNLATTENHANMTGIMFYARNTKVYNNMIRLGIDADGNSVSGNYIIIGIKQASNNCAVNYNTVYIGGQAQSADTSTYAYRRTTAGWSYPQATDLYNNIFMNERTNSSKGNNHYAVGFQMVDNFNPVQDYINNLNSDYNLLYSLGGTIAETGVGDFSTLADWQSYFGKDMNSLSGEVHFINKSGAADVVDLHIDISIQPCIIEDKGVVIPGMNNDIDLEVRYGAPGYLGGGTAPDIGADEIYDPSLPVSLLYFNATCKVDHVLINWATASEINNSHFTVEKSTNSGETWNEIAILSGSGTSNQLNVWEQIDYIENNENGMYYRLKQTDFDGKFEYFHPVQVDCINDIGIHAEIFPNPFSDFVNVYLAGSGKNDFEFYVYDITGMLVYETNISEGFTSLDLSHLSKGVYFISIFNEVNKTKSFKIIKN